MRRVSVPLRAAGVCMALGGLLIAPSAAHPSIIGDRSVAEVVMATGGWRAMHLAVLWGGALTVIGAAGIVTLYEDGLGRVGHAALAAVFVGAVVTAGIMATEAVMFPAVAEHAPHLIDVDGPVIGDFGARVGGSFSVALPLGLAVLAGAVFRRRDHRAPALMLALGAFGWIAFQLPFVPYLGPAATLVWSAAQVWWGRVLWRSE